MWAMDMFTARERRLESLNRMDCNADTCSFFFINNNPIKWEAYRSPYYSDSASTVITVQFLADLSLREQDVYTTDIAVDDSLHKKQGFDDFYIVRTPNRIVKVGNTSTSEIGKAVLRLYAVSNDNDVQIREIYEKCSRGGVDWQFKDMTIGNELRFPDVMDEYWTDIPARRGTRGFGWLNNLLKKFGESGNTSKFTLWGGTVVPLTDVDSNYAEKRYVYDGCPCLPIKELNGYTVSDIQTFLYKNPPMCSIESMSNALSVLWIILDGKYLTKNEDIYMLKRRMVQINSALRNKIKFREELKAVFPNEWYERLKEVNTFCLETWEANFRDTLGNPLYAYEPNNSVVAYIQKILFTEVTDSVSVREERRGWRITK
jgi:hypothetical protein